MYYVAQPSNPLMPPVPEELHVERGNNQPAVDAGDPFGHELTEVLGMATGRRVRLLRPVQLLVV